MDSKAELPSVHTCATFHPLHKAPQVQLLGFYFGLLPPPDTAQDMTGQVLTAAHPAFIVLDPGIFSC